MATPMSPIVPGLDLPEIIYAKDQPEYRPLPIYKNEDGFVLSRWHLTWKERFLVLLRGDIYLSILTFNKPLQPIKVDIEKPGVE